MKHGRFISLFGLATLALASCGKDNSGDASSLRAPDQTQAAAVDPSAAFLEMAARHAAAFLATAPELATDLGVSEEIAGEDYLSRLGSYGFESHQNARDMNEQFLEELRAVDRDKLSGDAAITYDILKNAYETAARRNQFGFGGATPFGGSLPNSGADWAITPYMVTQLTGPHLYLPRMLQTQHPVETKAHAQSYLSRLADFGRVMGEVVETIGSDAALPVTPPKFAIEGARRSIASITAPAPAENPLVTSFAGKLENVGALTDEEREDFAVRATALVETVVYPAYARLDGQLETLEAQADNNAGVWRLGPEGEAFYQLALNAYGAGGMNGDEVHDLGLQEVTRINAEMDAILNAQGLTQGSVATRMAQLGARDGATYPNTDEGRAALLDTLREQVAEVQAKAPQWFGVLPTQKVEVRRIPVHEQDSSPGGYYDAPSLDGTRPGIYWINLKDTADNPKHSLPTLTYHEAVPGHHFQISLQRAIGDMPLLRNMLSYSEFAEGWALYGEKLAKEMGMYDDDPFGDLGRLQAEIFRAARLVVDSGIHHKQWSREEAIDYMVSVTGETRASVTREIERYAVIPGQACSYKLGMIKIGALRVEAEAALGDQFDIKEFHDQVLLTGAAPMPVLEAKIRRWIENKTG